MNALSLQRTQPRPLSSSFSGEAARSTASATPRATERSGAQRELPRMDAAMLTRLGSSFAPAPFRATEQTVRAGATPNLAIADNGQVESSLKVNEALKLKGGSVSVDIPHTYQGDLVVTLTSPSGKSLTLHDRAGGSTDNLKAKFDLSAFAGESSQGDWKLTVADKAGQDVGTLKAWDLELTGTSTTGEEPPTPPTDDPFQGLRDAALLAAIKKASTGKDVVSYNEARKIIFSELDVKNGKVRDVYTGREIAGGKIPNSSDMNVEHTWPQSKGATGDAKSDLHHLFPTDSKANSTRGSFPFGTVEKVQWSQNGAKFGLDAQGRKVFEPPDEHKGNVARALFYFSAEYNKRIAPEEEAVLREWNKLDEVDSAELERTRRIATYQGNVNQFVEHSNLVDRIQDF
ncbi:endonuclease [Hyalangium rubrum]|uniref:Endonuclease n=1 Tax=Hyalangium rubrum TaxID=3103134 RepID=A0ABU5H1N0_9BACT|nr:endonuclease [Hyalangium sp. s54d21]MDY7227361.1 endonuclease [Hyalangium sp. s54d21]